MSKIFLAILISFFSVNSHALLKVRTNDGRIIKNENLKTDLLNGQLIMSDIMNITGSPLILSQKAILESGFRSGAQMLDLITKTKNFPNAEYLMNCSVLETQVSSCFFQ